MTLIPMTLLIGVSECIAFSREGMESTKMLGFVGGLVDSNSFRPVTISAE